MNAVLRTLIALLCLIVCGCAIPQAPINGEAARVVVEKYLNNTETKTAGPLTKKTAEDDFAQLDDSDRQKASKLLEQGALGFSVFVPDYSLHTSKGVVTGMIKFERVVFVRGTEVVGDFKAR